MWGQSPTRPLRAGGQINVATCSGPTTRSHYLEPLRFPIGHFSSVPRKFFYRLLPSRAFTPWGRPAFFRNASFRDGRAASNQG
jgi:hypothetical protein